MTGDLAAFDPDTAALLLSRAAADALLRDGQKHAVPAASPESGAAWTSLTEAGAIQGGQPHPRLAAAVQAARAPMCRLRLERHGHEVDGWVDAHAAALLVPRERELLELICVPVELLPDAVARLVELGPRPRLQPAIRLKLPAAALALLLAGEDPDQAAAAVGDEEAEVDAARALSSSFRVHWRVEARWDASSDSPGARAVEVTTRMPGYGWWSRARRASSSIPALLRRCFDC